MGEATTITLRSAIACAVCRRTLLRGEHADVFRRRGTRRLVCDLCNGVAIRRGWTPEGAEVALASRLWGRIRRRVLRRRCSEPAFPIV